jgi:hypothetical protein
MFENVKKRYREGKNKPLKIRSASTILNKHKNKENINQTQDYARVSGKQFYSKTRFVSAVHLPESLTRFQFSYKLSMKTKKKILLLVSY